VHGLRANEEDPHVEVWWVSSGWALVSSVVLVVPLPVPCAFYGRDCRYGRMGVFPLCPFHPKGVVWPR
jgi:hypothetical protein